MKDDFRARLATALLSGDYKQTVEKLRRTFSEGEGGECLYCVLGVLLDISGLGHWVGDTYWFGRVSNEHGLMRSLREAFELDTAECDFLTTLNDHEEWTFAEIGALLNEPEKYNQQLAKFKREAAC